MSAVDDVIAAWVNPGKHPVLHERKKQELRMSWPTLARALEELCTPAPECPTCHGEGFLETGDSGEPTDWPLCPECADPSLL